jgi:hypothetical protein
MMKSYEQMTVLYRQYRDGRIGRVVFEAKLIQEIKRRFRFLLDRRPHGDDVEDFLAWAYPRIHNAIDRYTEQGSCFDGYIHSLVREAYREYGQSNLDRLITERTVWTEKAHEYAAEGASRYSQEEAEEEKAAPFAAVSNPKQILALLLKAYHDVSDELLARIAPALGMREEELEMLMAQMRELRAEREEELHDLRERVHAQFYRYLSFQYRAAAAAPGSAKQQRYQRCMERGLKRLHSMRETLRALRTGASNQEIAAVLGVSKGAVDASLHYLRKSFGGEEPEQKGDGEHPRGNS